MSGIPPIDQSLLPAEVRNGTTKDKQTYGAALGFERALMGEMTKAMAETAKPVDDGGDDSDSSQDSATSMYMDMLPDQLADGLEQSGGLGLAKTFYDSMKERTQ